MKIYAYILAVVRGVLGVDERNSMPLVVHLDDFDWIVFIGFNDGCKEIFFRFFDLADVEEYNMEASEFILKKFKLNNKFGKKKLLNFIGRYPI